MTSHTLDNYRQLIVKVEALCSAIAAMLGEQITCSAGCSSCCTSITIFPVEAAAMREALLGLSEWQADEIRRHVAEQADGERCPLLLHDHCLLYKARPIICRTHGFPIIYSADGRRQSDCCPRNMTEQTSPLAGSKVVDLDTLNTLLVAINSIYLSQVGTATELRMTIAEALSDTEKKIISS
ncbi:MAG: YkgJ family cysteine cluster protein [Desulfuromonadaceae bacterium]|nr:YkgJ family cysteine cluster protein [Desulfuromonadaceae bacterium]